MKQPKADFDVHAEFVSVGLDAESAFMIAAIEDWLGLELASDMLLTSDDRGARQLRCSRDRNAIQVRDEQEVAGFGRAAACTLHSINKRADKRFSALSEHLRAAKLLLILAFGLSACSYSPPNASDLNRPGYQADLAACHEAADTEAHHQVIAYGQYWFSYPVSLFVLKHREMNKCMQGKGYISYNS